jgi:hypothetical protein
VSAPANVTAKLKPIAKGASEAEVELTPAANAAVGAGTVILRGTAKVGGKDVAVVAVPKEFTITAAAKKDEPKKTEPKKEKK